MIYLVFRDWGCDTEFHSAWKTEQDAKDEVNRKEKEWLLKMREHNDYPWIIQETELK